MGWLFPYETQTKAQLIERLTKPSGANYDVLDKSVVGNHLWMVIELRETGRRFITLDLMQSSPDGWGYKDMDESMHPYYYDCPPRLLTLAGPTTNEQAKAWRSLVIQHHAKKKALRANPPQAGDKITYGGVEYTLVESLGRSGWLVKTTCGSTYRMPAKYLSKARQQALEAA